METIIGSGQTSWGQTPTLVEGGAHSPLDALASPAPAPVAHPYVWAWGALTDQHPEVIKGRLWRAAQTGAPADATLETGDRWRTLADIRNPRSREFMRRWAAERDLPVPTWPDED